jgi:aminopeptidase N
MVWCGSAFPCWDEPAVKATFSVTLVVPEGLTALSNMPEVSSTSSAVDASVPAGHKKVVFDKSPKMSTYLLAWAVGEMDYVEAVTQGGVALRVYSPPGRGPQGKFALDVGVRSLDFYDKFFKVSD